MSAHFTFNLILFISQAAPPPSYSSFSLHNMAASTLHASAGGGGEGTNAATSLPPAVRVRLYELFVQVRHETFFTPSFAIMP